MEKGENCLKTKRRNNGNKTKIIKRFVDSELGDRIVKYGELWVIVIYRWINGEKVKQLEYCGSLIEARELVAYYKKMMSQQLFNRESDLENNDILKVDKYPLFVDLSNSFNKEQYFESIFELNRRDIKEFFDENDI